MATFAYIARDSAGQRVSGKLTGGNAQSVLAELESRKLAPVKVEEVRESTGLRRGVSTRHLAQAYRQMADLLRAGVPLLRALRLLGRSKSNPRLAKVMGDVADRVADGERLADAMAAHEEIFPSIQIAMVRAGERGGFLEAVLARMADFLEHQADMQAKVVGNLIYPVALLLLGLGIVIFAMVFFVPQFEEFYGRMEVPLPTQILLGASDLLVTAWPILLAAAVLAGAGVWWVVRQSAVRRQLAIWQLRVPKLGPVVQSVSIARFTRTLGTMLENGIPLLTAMQISRDSAGHVLLAEAVDEAIESVRAGESLAEPLGRSGLFSDDVVEMIAVGESANNLAEVLVTIADTIEKRIDRMLTLLMRFIEPVLLLGLAMIVLFIFIALIVPMLRMGASI